MSDNDPVASRVFLVGLMGAGKSTVGVALGRLLGFPYHDNDVLLARQSGTDALHLASHGRQTLHEQESRQLHALLWASPPFVAGVAASVADQPDDLAAMMSAGVVVYLRAQPETLANRIGRGAGRPWLAEDPLTELRQMFDSRDPVYRRATLVIDTDVIDPYTVASAVASQLKEVLMFDREADPGAAPASQASIGVTGLGVMGANLARNLARHGHTVALHNRSVRRTQELMAQHGHEGAFVATESVEEFVRSLHRPRRIIIMVKAGAATDAVIDELTPLLEPGDIVVDAGNAHFADTRRRESALRQQGLHFVGVGVSGGEEGALLGPSIMPGGSPEAYAALGPALESIAATVDGVACCAHIGPDGAGHFVKMVHNGIEYADMQLIAEAYDLLRYGAGRSPAEIADIFRTWNHGDLDSYLIEITAEVLGHVDAATGKPFVDIVVDRAEQKGTGGWTVQIALDLGIPVSGIAASVFARSLSGQTMLRDAAREAGAVSEPLMAGAASAPAGAGAVGSRPLVGTEVGIVSETFVDDVRAALYASKIVAYAQGFDMIRAGSEQYGWHIDPGQLATIWRGGCIIRARFLDRIRQAYELDPKLPSLIFDPYFASVIADGEKAWRGVVAAAIGWGIPVPGFAAALGHLDALRRDRLPAALIQGLRDFFGAHTYHRVDRAGSFHTTWAQERNEVQE